MNATYDIHEIPDAVVNGRNSYRVRTPSGVIAVVATRRRYDIIFHAQTSRNYQTRREYVGISGHIDMMDLAGAIKRIDNFFGD